MKLISDFYLWFVPHNLLPCTAEQGSEQSTLRHLNLRLGSYSHEVKVPFSGANPPSVGFIFLKKHTIVSVVKSP